MRCVIATTFMLRRAAFEIIGCTDVIPASATQDVHPSHRKFVGSAGTRTRNQRLKRALLYRLSYRPASSFSLDWLQKFSMQNQPRKLSGLLYRLSYRPSVGASLSSACEIFQCTM